MRRSTIVGYFIGLFALTMNAQVTQSSALKSSNETVQVEIQKKSPATLQELLGRYQNLGNQKGSVSDHFSKEEQQMLYSYFNNQKPKNQAVNALGSSAKAKGPLFIAPAPLTAAEESEILAASQQGVITNLRNNLSQQYGNSLAPIIPTAGATESFAVVTGDFFYDPTDGTNGGPGGDCSTTSSGDPGDYPNCGCVTTTTLTGTDLSVEFLSFRVFGTFDFLNIYDGSDTSAPQIYDSNLNTDTDTLAGMIAANGSGVFTSTSGALTFEFNATAVVNTCGWEVEVLSAGGGGGNVLDTAYGVNNSNVELIGFPVSDPSTVEVFGDSPVTVNFENAGAIDPANPTTGYVLDNGGQFYSFDVESGFYILLGNIPGDWVGMEFDQASGILYAIAGADLYTIDPVAVTATLVGATGIPPSDLPIALAIDGAGVGYTYEIVTDNLYSIDLTTATATLIGNIGYDANFGQGMCYDALTDTVYMAAFNSTSFAGEWRSVDTATGATTLIGPILTTAATTQVAWVSIGETLPPPTCPEPTNLAVTNIGPDSADLSWDAEPNASSGYIWYVFDQGANPVTDTPVTTGTTPAGTTSATATGLTGGFNYDFYVVADCDTDGLSQYAGPITFATPPACGGKFFDTGGATGDYQNNENVTTTITPDNPGEQVTVTFTAFNVEESWDALYVYDGPDASFPLISSGNPPTNSGFPAGGYYGTSIPGPFVSSDPSGALTFVFLSDSSVPRSGWEADITCALSPPPNDMIVNSIDVDELGFPYTDPGVHMPAATTEDGNPVDCDLTGANGVWYNFVSGGDGTANAMIVTPGGASSVTFYTAPNENAVETDLTLVPQQSNQCGPGTSASIFTLAGQAYYVFVVNSGAITDIVIDGTNLGVSDNAIIGFSYYPNPTEGVLNLKSVDNIENVSMYNILGQRVMDSQVDATESKLDISGLSTGTYLMKVTVNGQIGTYKVLKQ